LSAGRERATVVCSFDCDGKGRGVVEELDSLDVESNVVGVAGKLAEGEGVERGGRERWKEWRWKEIEQQNARV
jgi:hypothetical protein